MAENFELLFAGLATAVTPYNLMACIIGGILGIFVGALPGIGAVAGCSLLLPITYKMNPVAAIIMLAGTVVNSSIILVEYIKIRRAMGEDRETAILHA